MEFRVVQAGLAPAIGASKRGGASRRPFAGRAAGCRGVTTARSGPPAVVSVRASSKQRLESFPPGAQHRMAAVRELLRGAVRLHVLHHAASGELNGAWMAEELGRHGY